jgi:HSP20 family protein
MELKKLAPWNWFKKEEEEHQAVPIGHDRRLQPPVAPGGYHPMMQLQREIDQLFASFFRGFDIPVRGNFQPLLPVEEAGMFIPQVDLSATDQEYRLTVEIPGVAEKDVTVNISGNTMTIKGEKKQEKEEKDKDYYRIERNYGSFQRILSLPEDVDQDAIKATFKNGVLSVTMPRKVTAKSEVKRIEISATD